MIQFSQVTLEDIDVGDFFVFDVLHTPMLMLNKLLKADVLYFTYSRNGEKHSENVYRFCECWRLYEL